MTAAPRKLWITCAMMAGFGLLLTPVAAEAGDCDPVTDADELAAMGFEPDADVVVCAPEGAASEAAPVAGTYFSAISAKEFIGRVNRSGTAWRYTGGPNCCVDLSRAGTERFADAQFILPDGASLRRFRWWAFDASSADLAFFVFENCQPADGAGPITINTIVNESTSGAGGNQFGEAVLNTTVKNETCTYLARVRFDEPSRDLVLQKVLLTDETD